MNLHVDVVGNDWNAGEQRLLGRFIWEPTQYDDGSGERMFLALSDKYGGGSYFWVSEPHNACLFTESDVLPMSVR